MSKKKQKTIKVDLDTAEKLDYMAKVLNTSRPKFLSKLTNELFSLLASFKNANIQYDLEVTSRRLTIEASGKSRLVFGSAPNDIEAKQQISEKFTIPLASLKIAKKETFPKEGEKNG